MATIEKAVTLVNPGRRKRRVRNSRQRMTAKQIKYFGTKRQKAALFGKRHSNAGKRSLAYGMSYKGTNRKTRRAKSSAQAKYYHKRHLDRQRMRDKRSLYGNVGEILTIRPLLNGSTSRRVRNVHYKKRIKKGQYLYTNMARVSHKRRLAGLKAARTRKRRLSARRHHNLSSHRRRSYRRRRYSNGPGVVVRYRNTRRHRRSHRRSYRNPGFMSGAFGQALGIIAGAFVTKLGTGFLPASLTTGIPGYIAIALVAMLQGKAVGKLLKNPSLGKDMAIGGYVYLALKIASDYMPGLGLPFGLSGLGQVYGPSSFYTPQVPLNGNMGAFVTPAAVRAAIPPPAVATAAGMRGLGARRVGRMR